MTISDSHSFDFLSSRLYCIDFTADPMLNVELWYSLIAFENHVFGVVLQYSRISSDLEIAEQARNPPTRRHHAGLDTYY